ncbi:DUF1641 domain-containing protein [Deinococcus budaensis]|uniref:Uncharacterized protein YjgD (DUF1641 family) n=1 Tax=Deinococcus budaensis TaxID=1665626 RepID=A0A7W8LPP6_9DEIO|nr:DUF1641 domain-containing protein [Deinococcus budaensis]MBB5233991.1 uncharacterized protein YjgD (DUF1641 family) [Deinococcus budaensis]
MAKAIDFDARSLRPTLQEQVAAGTAQSADALLEALALLRELHQHKVLHTLLRAVQGGEGLSVQALEVLNEPGSVRALRNLLELVKLLGSIEPEAISTVSGALADGVRAGAERVRQREPIGLGELLSLSRDPDLGLALGALVDVLRGFGRGLREREAHGNPPPVPHT